MNSADIEKVIGFAKVETGEAARTFVEQTGLDVLPPFLSYLDDHISSEKQIGRLRSKIADLEISLISLRDLALCEAPFLQEEEGMGLVESILDRIGDLTGEPWRTDNEFLDLIFKAARLLANKKEDSLNWFEKNFGEKSQLSYQKLTDAIIMFRDNGEPAKPAMEALRKSLKKRKRIKHWPEEVLWDMVRDYFRDYG